METKAEKKAKPAVCCLITKYQFIHLKRIPLKIHQTKKKFNLKKNRRLQEEKYFLQKKKALI